jgi:hypothetical protein
MNRLKEMLCQDLPVTLMSIGIFLVCVSLSIYMIAITFKLYL